ncbi:MAG: VCBS repeat-containing protein, partial [Planctomycetes bacterium]|nr:VCBS repeat-containing protein [Planctomycetota bacterium]
PTGLRGAPALGDFDRDGDLDALWPSPLGRVQINEGERGWRDLRAEIEVRDAQGMRLQFSGELCCADFTGDGLADVAAVMQAGDDGGPQSLVLLEGTGQEDSPFRPVISAAIRGRIFDLTPADFNADGRLDLALGFGTPGQDARLTLLQLDAGRQFAPFDGSPSAKGRLLDLALDDLDRDGDLDLMVSEEVEGAVALTLWANTGTGAFADSGEAGTSLRRALGEFRATNLSLADFTGDGRSDLLAVDAEGNVVVVRTTLP